MCLKVTVLPLNREEILWTKEVNHQLKFASIGMSRYTKALRNHLNSSTSFIDSVVNTCHYGFLSNAWSCYDINQISILDLNVTVTTNSHLLKAIDWFTHTTIFEDNQLVVFKLVHVFWFDNKFFMLHSQFFETNGCADNIFYVKTSKNNTTSVISS